MFASMIFTCLLFISLLCKFHVTSKSIISNTFYVCQVLFISIFVTSKVVLSNCGFLLAIDCLIAVGSPVSTPLPYYSLYRSCAVISCVSAFWAMPSNTKLQAEQAWQASSLEALILLQSSRPVGSNGNMGSWGNRGWWAASACWCGGGGQQRQSSSFPPVLLSLL